MPILMKTRGSELDPGRADAEIEAARKRVTEMLDKGPKLEGTPSEASTEPGENFAMTVLARRLAHIEYTAHKVARLAARPVIADENEHAY
jgi:hypothetical protein